MTPLAALLLLHLSLLPLALSFKAPRSAAEQSRCRSLRPVFLLLTWRLAKAADDEEDLCIKSGSCRQVRGDFKKELSAQRQKRIEEGATPEVNYMEVLNGSGAGNKDAKKSFSPFKRPPRPATE